ncbi:protein FAM131A isoform X1 [Aotus nancymaae]|uniref:protein FAM131A isoform X1 n=2 Tax=Aotus nancymaae TaxID=37293 RepID=UPI000625E49F|nr:protein FAM131A isoform X1 [Aotus nancymaae]
MWVGRPRGAGGGARGGGSQSPGCHTLLLPPLPSPQRFHSWFFISCPASVSSGCQEGGGLAEVLLPGACLNLHCFLGGQNSPVLASSYLTFPCSHCDIGAVPSSSRLPLMPWLGMGMLEEAHCCQRGTDILMVSPKVNVGDTVAMLPKSRRALTIQEIAALARSSLHGISQVVKDHVTKPTAMAQGRVAHLIEWKGWSKPSDSPAALESAFSSYSDLSEGEQEARFAAGVAEQFAIAEAKLRAWSSVDGEDSTDDSYDEDFAGGTDSDLAGQLPLGPHLQDLFTGHRFSRPVRQGSVEPESDCSQTVSPDTLCSSLCSLEDGLLGSPARLASQLLGDELLLAKLPPSRESAFRSLGPLEAQDSLYNSPLTESCLSPAEEEPAPCKDCQPLCPPLVGTWERQRQASDVASSGVVSLDEDEAEPEEQ